MSIVAFTAFPQADGTNISGQPLEIGGSWTVVGGTFNVTSGKLTCLTLGSDGAIVVTDAGKSDVAVAASANVITSAAQDCDLVLRYTDTNNFWLLQLYCDGGGVFSWNIYKKVAGTYTLLAGPGGGTDTGLGSLVTLNTPFRLDGYFVGNKLIATVKVGSTSFSRTVSNDSFNNTATIYGFRMGVGSTATDFSVDWAVADAGSFGVTGGAATLTYKSLLVFNGGFETPYTAGIAAGWGARYGGITASQETTIVHGGTSSQHIVAVGGSFFTVDQIVVLQPSTRYRVSGWLNVVSGSVGFIIQDTVTFGSWGIAAPIGSTSGVWQYVEFYINQSSYPNPIYLCSYSNNVASEWYADDFAIVEAPANFYTLTADKGTFAVSAPNTNLALVRKIVDRTGSATVASSGTTVVSTSLTVKAGDIVVCGVSLIPATATATFTKSAGTCTVGAFATNIIQTNGSAHAILTWVRVLTGGTITITTTSSATITNASLLVTPYAVAGDNLVFQQSSGVTGATGTDITKTLTTTNPGSIVGIFATAIQGATLLTAGVNCVMEQSNNSNVSGTANDLSTFMGANEIGLAQGTALAIHVTQVSGSTYAAIAYELAVDINVAGVYTLTGKPATFTYTHKLLASPRSFTLTGQPTTLVKSGKVLTAVSGAFAVTGSTASLARAVKLATFAGSTSLAIGLDRYYAFSSGVFLSDNSGNGRTLTNHGATQGSTGINGNCATLVAASSQYLQSTALPFTPASSFTLAFWLNPNSLSGNVNACPVNTFDDNSSGAIIQIVDGSGHMKILAVTSAGASTAPDPTNALVASVWNLVIVYFDLANNLVGIQINNNTPVEVSLGGGTLNTGSPLLTIGSYFDGHGVPSLFFDGSIDEIAFWNVSLTPALRNAVWNGGSGVTPPFPGLVFTFTGKPAGFSHGTAVASAAGAFTFTGKTANFRRTYALPAAANAFVFSGKTAGITATRKLVAAVNPFVFTGKTAGMAFGHAIVSSKGIFAETGNVATITATRKAVTVAGPFVWTGSAATFRRTYAFPAAANAFIFTGQVASLTYTAAAKILTASAGAFAFTGQVAAVGSARKIAAAATSFVRTGFAATFRRTYAIPSVVGAFAFTGQVATVTTTRKVIATFGSFIWTGSTATLARGYKFPSAANAYVFTGKTAGLAYGHIVITSAGVFVESGQAATITPARKLAASLGSFIEAGQAAGLSKSGASLFNAGVYVFTGKPAGLTVARTLTAAAGTFNEVGSATPLAVGRKIVASAGSLLETGRSASLQFGHVIVCSAQAFTEAGSVATVIVGRKILAVSGSIIVSGSSAGLTKTGVTAFSAGAYAFTGKSAGLTRTYAITAAVGSFLESGISINLVVGKKLAALAGAYIRTGNAATFTINRALASSKGIFVFAGMNAGLSKSGVSVFDVGAFAVSGKPASLTVNRTSRALPGAFQAQGKPISIAVGRKIVLAAGSFGITGRTAQMAISRGLQASEGAFSLSGLPTSLIAARSLGLDADAGIFIEDGQRAVLSVHRVGGVGSPSGAAFLWKTQVPAGFF